MPTLDLLKAWTELLHAAADLVGSLLWPIVAFLIIFRFRSDISLFFERLKKGKALGIEVELEQLNRQAAKVESKDVLPLPPPKPPEIGAEGSIRLPPLTVSGEVELLSPRSDTPSAHAGSISGKESGSSTDSSQWQANQKTEFADSSNDVLRATDTVGASWMDEIIDVARSSPQLAVISLAGKIERQVRLLMAVMGIWREHTQSLPRNVTSLERHHYITPEMKDAILTFWRIRNPLVHGTAVSQEALMSALDSGIRIYEALSSIPHQTNIVKYGNLTLYSDETCKLQIPNVIGVMLVAENDVRQENVYPSTRIDYYAPGMQVSWEWNFEVSLGETWYRDPRTDQIKYAFVGSANFVGRDLSEII